MSTSFCTRAWLRRLRLSSLYWWPKKVTRCWGYFYQRHKIWHMYSTRCVVVVHVRTDQSMAEETKGRKATSRRRIRQRCTGGRMRSIRARKCNRFMLKIEKCILLCNLRVVNNWGHGTLSGRGCVCGVGGGWENETNYCYPSLVMSPNNKYPKCQSCE